MYDQRDLEEARTKNTITDETNIIKNLGIKYPKEFLELVNIITSNCQGKGGMLPPSNCNTTGIRTAIDMLLGTSSNPSSSQIRQPEVDTLPNPNQEHKRENV